MAAVALLKFTQGVTVGADGQALKGVIGTSVNVTNSNNLDVASWQLDLVYVDPRSGIPTATPYAFSNNGNTPSASFSPDAKGSYRWVLKVWNVVNRVGNPADTDIRVFVVPESNGLVVPPAQRWPKPLPTPESGQAGNKPNELNFSGQVFGWAGEGDDGLLNDLIKRVDLFVPGTAVQETLAVDSLGQTSFLLSQDSSSPTTVEMYVNGSKQQYGNDYDVTGKIVTYYGFPDLDVTDVVEFWYLVGSVASSGPSTHQETLTVNSDGQHAFTLSQAPTESSTVAMYVNGVKQQYGTDYTVAAANVNYPGNDLVTTDTVEFWYVTGQITASGDNGLTLPVLLTGASNTLDASHYPHKILQVSHGSAADLTVPTNAAVAFPVGANINLYQDGVGQVTIVAAGGVTIRTPETLKLRKQYSSAQLVKIATDEWLLTGDLELAP